MRNILNIYFYIFILKNMNIDNIDTEILNGNTDNVMTILRNFINEKFLLACRNKQYNVASYLLSRYSMDNIDDAAVIAVENNDLELLQMVVIYGATLTRELYNLANEKNYTNIMEYIDEEINDNNYNNPMDDYNIDEDDFNNLEHVDEDLGYLNPVDEGFGNNNFIINEEDFGNENFIINEDEDLEQQNLIRISDNPTVMVIINPTNIICSQSNQYEDNAPLDPVSLEKIPISLFVSVVRIVDYENRVENDILNARCYDARSLYRHWISQAGQNPPQNASDTITREEFDETSINYVTELVVNYIESANEIYYQMV